MPTDADLLRQSRTDPVAFGELYGRYASAVHGYLARRIGSEAAEDLVSEVFLVALKARDRVRPHANGSALPWLYGIARNLLLEHGRRSSHRWITAVRIHEADYWRETDDRIDAERQRPMLREVLASLSESDREVLLLIAWEQLSITEAAEALGVASGTARTRYHRARMRAAAALAAASLSALDPGEMP